MSERGFCVTERELRWMFIFACDSEALSITLYNCQFDISLSMQQETINTWFSRHSLILGLILPSFYQKCIQFSNWTLQMMQTLLLTLGFLKHHIGKGLSDNRSSWPTCHGHKHMGLHGGLRYHYEGLLRPPLYYDFKNVYYVYIIILYHKNI